MTTLFRGIGWRIFFSFSTLLIGLTLILSFVALKFVQKTATDNAANELRVLSVTLSEELQRYMKRVQSGMKSLSAGGGVLDQELQRLSPREQNIRRFLESRLGALSPFETLAVFDTSGICVASTDPDWVGVPAQREQFFITGLKHFGFAEIYERGEDNEKVLLVSAPINEGSDPHGVLVGKIKLSSLYDLMGQQLGVGARAEAFLLDSKLRFITPGKTAPDELLQSHLAHTPLVQHLEEEFWVGEYKNFKGTDVLGTVMRPPGLRWYLVVERDLDEVQTQVAEVKKALFTATSVLLFALILVTILLTTSITKPLQDLVEATRRIAAGDLRQPLHIRAGTDEIAYLANEFDRMRARVAASQGRLIEQLEESEQRRLESERLAAIGTLAASMAHEIRNPLNAVSLLMSRLERFKGPDDERRKVIDEMRGEIARLDRLVSDILDYARPLQLQREPMDLGGFIKGMAEFYKEVLEEKHVTLNMALPEEPVMIEGDRDKLRQAFVNLIQNGVEAMAGGGTLSFFIERKNKLAICVVKDTGIGIPPSAMSRLFDLFFTTKEQGTGLGLSVVRKIIDAHGGRIDISSQTHKGTIVTLTFPSSQS